MSHPIDDLDKIIAETEKTLNILDVHSDCTQPKSLSLGSDHTHAILFLAPFHSKIECHALIITAIFDQGLSAKEIFKFIAQIPNKEIKQFLYSMFDDYFEASKRFPAYTRLRDMLDVLNKYPLSQIPGDTFNTKNTATPTYPSQKGKQPQKEPA